MKKCRCRTGRGIVHTICACLVGGMAAAGTHELKLPPETAMLTASPLPGYKIAAQKCGICHSADYVNLQPPQMSLTQWTAEMVKMQHSYGAPITDAQIQLLGIYLASTYGAATTAAADEAAPTSPASTAPAESLGARPAGATR